VAQVFKANTDEAAKAKARVLKLADFAAEARAVVLEARKDAARIVASARTQADDYRRQAAEEGYAEGHARGMEQGLAQGRRQATDEVRRQVEDQARQADQVAARIVEELTRSREQLVQEARSGLLQFALDLAGRIVGRLAVGDVRVAERNLAKALDLARSTGELTVLVNPVQLDQLNEFRQHLVQTLGLRGKVSLVGDERIEPGGVKVVSRSGEIDATIGRQLDSLAELIFAVDQDEPACPPDEQDPLEALDALDERGEYVSETPAQGDQADDESAPTHRAEAGLDRRAGAEEGAA